MSVLSGLRSLHEISAVVDLYGQFSTVDPTQNMFQRTQAHLFNCCSEAFSRCVTRCILCVQVSEAKWVESDKPLETLLLQVIFRISIPLTIFESFAGCGRG